MKFNFRTSILIDNLPKDLDVYIIRHGEGTHNKYKKILKKFNFIRQLPVFGHIISDIDNPLTDKGNKQAENAGIIMSKCISNQNASYTSLNNINKVYSSDLKRTQETLIKFFKGLNKEIPDNKITVIPCAHEIGGYNSMIYSDDGFPGLLPIAFENTTGYNPRCGSVTEVNNVYIKWDKYLEFYGGLSRNYVTCNDSSKFEDNFVTKAIQDYLTPVDNPDAPPVTRPVTRPDAPPDAPPVTRPVTPSQLTISIEAPKTASVGGGKKSKIKTHKKPQKVKVTYKNKTKIIPKKYIAGLKGKERKAQIKSIFENTDRPKTSFKEKRSQWIIKFEKKYNQKITDKSWIHKNIITNTGQNKILSKGRGAYYSSGSRPNQTPDSWAYARLASVIMNGPSRKYDMKIWNKYKV